MAMQRPNPRIVGIVLDDGVPRGIRVYSLLHDVGIPPRRVRQVGHGSAVVGAVALVDDEEVVAVEVHGVRRVGGVDVVVENDADGGGLAEVVNVPLGGERVGDVSAVGFAEDGVTSYFYEEEANGS